MMAMHNKGLGKHYHDPVGPDRDKKIGLDGDSRLMIHFDERLTGGAVKKVQISGDNGAPLLVKSLARRTGRWSTGTGIEGQKGVRINAKKPPKVSKPPPFEISKIG
jgi:hypothetical protein